MTILEYKESECVQKEDKAADRHAVQKKERVKKKWKEWEMGLCMRRNAPGSLLRGFMYIKTLW